MWVSLASSVERSHEQSYFPEEEGMLPGHYGMDSCLSFQNAGMPCRPQT